jgi:hypothetical protein
MGGVIWGESIPLRAISADIFAYRSFSPSLSEKPPERFAHVPKLPQSYTQFLVLPLEDLLFLIAFGD